MLEKLDFNDFFIYKKTNGKREIAVSLITPIQAIHVRPTDSIFNTYILEYHMDLFAEILKEIYRIGQYLDVKKPTYLDEIQKKVEEKIINGERNFINARYIVNETCQRALLEIPFYINQYQYFQLSILNKKLQDLKIDITVYITTYNPIILSCHDNEKDVYYDNNRKENISIDLSLALEYLKKNNRIIDYKLPFPEENILNLKEKTYKKKITIAK